MAICKQPCCLLICIAQASRLPFYIGIGFLAGLHHHRRPFQLCQAPYLQLNKHTMLNIIFHQSKWKCPKEKGIYWKKNMRSTIMKSNYSKWILYASKEGREKRQRWSKLRETLIEGQFWSRLRLNWDGFPASSPSYANWVYCWAYWSAFCNQLKLICRSLNKY